LLSTSVLFVLCWAFEPHSFGALRHIPIEQYWSPVYSAIGATIIGHGSLYYLLQRYEVNYVAPFITLSSLFAVVFGITFMGDVLTVRIMIGGTLTLLGVTVIALRNARQSTPVGLRVPR